MHRRVSPQSWNRASQILEQKDPLKSSNASQPPPPGSSTRQSSPSSTMATSAKKDCHPNQTILPPPFSSPSWRGNLRRQFLPLLQQRRFKFFWLRRSYLPSYYLVLYDSLYNPTWHSQTIILKAIIFLRERCDNLNFRSQWQSTGFQKSPASIKLPQPSTTSVHCLHPSPTTSRKKESLKLSSRTLTTTSSFQPSSSQATFKNLGIPR